MNSVLLGARDTLHLVYPPETREALAVDLTLNKDELEAHREELKDIRVIFSTWTMPALSEEEIARYFPNLEAVFYAAGSVQYFARPFLKRGVRVFSAWGANGVPVAEFTVAQILLANKGFFQLSRLYSGGDRQSRQTLGIDFPGNYNCKVGLIGAGMIGKLVIELLRRHHLEIQVFDPFLPEEQAAQLGVQK
ncbi:MAG: phosphoglycerate dehydrogenase, partial [Clostridia bacterium]|nr:phosphoglycerate dehydrogenase [Clostridia bacterium]